MGKLTALQVKNLKPGKHDDGDGLRFVVSASGSRRWVLRIQAGGMRREFGLGGYPGTTLEEARRKAEAKRVALRSGDIEERVRLSVGSKPVAATQVTVRMAFAEFFKTKEPTLSNAVHRRQWRQTMADYVFPHIGDKPVGEVTGPHVRALLLPIWETKTETAHRVLQRLKVVFAFAIFNGWRTSANPTEGVLQAMHGVRKSVKHHAAMPYADVPNFVEKLSGFRSWPETKLSLEWLILTATRSGETRGARWDEIDEKQRLWTIPGERMKGRKPHTVPLPPRCFEIIEAARALKRRSVLVFPSQEGGVLSDMTFTKLLRDQGYGEVATAHGFRSSFRDWCAEVAKVEEDVAEAALAHAVRNRVVAAYKRTQYLEERRILMERWVAFVCGYLAQR